MEELVHAKGGDMHTKDSKGRGCMHLASARGKLDVVKYLWSKSADLDAEDIGACSLYFMLMWCVLVLLGQLPRNVSQI